MKYLINFLLVGLAWTLHSCGGNEEEETAPSIRIPFSTISLSETVWQSDSPFPIFWEQEYDFDQGRVTECRTRQSMTISGETFTTESGETVTYTEEGKVTVTDDAGGKMTYTVDGQGIALTCVSEHPGGEQRSYTFDYETIQKKIRLAGVTEHVDGAFFSSITISYDSEEKATLRQVIGTSAQNFTLTWDTESPEEAAVPPLFLTELYPLSTHTTALYGGILGENGKWLKQVVVEGSRNEELNYTYLKDTKGNPSDCNEVRSSLQGESSSRAVHYHFTY